MKIKKAEDGTGQGIPRWKSRHLPALPALVPSLWPGTQHRGSDASNQLQHKQHSSSTQVPL